jgi:hypothetical protein
LVVANRRQARTIEPADRCWLWQPAPSDTADEQITRVHQYGSGAADGAQTAQ